MICHPLNYNILLSKYNNITIYDMFFDIIIKLIYFTISNTVLREKLSSFFWKTLHFIYITNI